jgi:hypothetical protein
MAKVKKQETKNPMVQPTQPESTKSVTQYAWMPLWGWVLLFVGPLLLSEYMFYRVGRSFSMVVFPLAWCGFWGWMLYRSDWAILRRSKQD